jgi:hypothetical protein
MTRPDGVGEPVVFTPAREISFNRLLLKTVLFFEIEAERRHRKKEQLLEVALNSSPSL